MPESLALIAELAVGLAGFSGVVVAFGGRARGLAPIDRMRSTGLLIAAFGTMLLATLPLLLDDAGLARESLWRTSSAIAVLHCIGTVWFAIRSRRGLPARDLSSLHPGMWALVLGGNAAMIPLLGGNALAWVSHVPFLAFLYFQLAYSALQFVRLFLVRPAEAADRDHAQQT